MTSRIIMEPRRTRKGRKSVQFDLYSTDKRPNGSTTAIVCINSNMCVAVELQFDGSRWHGVLDIPIRKDNIILDGRLDYIDASVSAVVRIGASPVGEWEGDSISLVLAGRCRGRTWRFRNPVPANSRDIANAP